MRQSHLGQTFLVRGVYGAFATLFSQFPLPSQAADTDAAGSKIDALMRSQGQGASRDRSHEDKAQRFVANLLVLDRSSNGSSPSHYCMGPQTVRDDLLRGRYDDATVRLSEALEQVQTQKALFRSATDWNERMSRWLDEAVEAEAQLQRAKRQNAAAELEAAQRRLDALWRGGAGASGGAAGRLPVWLVWLLGVTAEPLGADAAYLLALCKHEQAERAAARGRRVPENQVKDAWRTADRLWSQFLEEYPGAAAAAAARSCKARALQALGDSAGAAAQWLNLSGTMTPLEETGRLFRAKALRP
jgi:hypothetical protein